MVKEVSKNIWSGYDSAVWVWKKLLNLHHKVPLGHAMRRKIARRSIVEMNKLNIYICPTFIKKSHRPLTQFILFAQGRTGGELFFDLITSNKDIFYDGEILSVSKKLFPKRYVKGRCALSSKKVYGIKIKIYELTRDQKIMNPKAFMYSLYMMGFKIVYLKRRNCLRHILSNLIALDRIAYHHNIKNGSLKLQKIHVNPDELISGTKERQRMLAMEEEVLENIPHITVVYEDDLLRNENHQKTADKIFLYLGLSSVPVATKHGRITVDNIADIIENYEEVKLALAGTDYEEFLKE